jgi:hypothetical protein
MSIDCTTPGLLNEKPQGNIFGEEGIEGVQVDGLDDNES